MGDLGALRVLEKVVNHNLEHYFVQKCGKIVIKSNMFLRTHS